MPHRAAKTRRAAVEAKGKRRLAPAPTEQNEKASCFSGTFDVNNEDLDEVSRQLGYTPLNFMCVAARSPVDNRPLVAQLYPLNRNTCASEVWVSLNQSLLPNNKNP